MNINRRQFLLTSISATFLSYFGLLKDVYAAAKQSFRPSIVQGFNFHKDNQDLVGHITALKIGGEQYAADLKVQEPMKIEEGTKVEVVGVVSAIRWNGGLADPITFTAQVSFEGAKTAAVQTHKRLADTSVELAFHIYKYDPAVKKYYKCFHTGEVALKGLIEKNSGELEFEMDLEEQNREVPSPINFELYLSVMPQQIEQSVYIADSAASEQKTEKWGSAS